MSLITVEPVLLFYMLGIFLLFSVFHKFVYERVCTSQFPMGSLSPEEPLLPNISEQNICGNLTAFPEALSLVQAETSRIIKISTMCMTIPSILVDCYLGSWSDLFGRKVTLMLPPLGSALGTLVNMIVGKDKNEMEWKRTLNILDLMCIDLLTWSNQYNTVNIE